MNKREMKAVAYLCAYILSGYIHSRNRVVDSDENVLAEDDYNIINKAYNDLYANVCKEAEDGNELYSISIVERYLDTCEQMKVFKIARIYKDKVLNNAWTVFSMVKRVDKNSRLIKKLRKIINYDYGFGFKAYKIVNKLNNVEEHTVEMLSNVWVKGERDSIYSCKLKDGVIIDFVNNRNRLIANLYKNNSLVGQVDVNKGLKDGGEDLVIDMIHETLNSDI